MPSLRRAPAWFVASATLVVHSLAVAAPPLEQPEPAPAIESAPAPAIESTPAPAIESEPAPASEPESEPTQPELPSWDAPLPSYEQLPEIESPQQFQPETPPDGNGSTAVGAMLLGGGVVLAATSGVLIFEDDEVGLWVAGAALSSVAIATGMGLLISGAVKRQRYRPWHLQHDAPPPGTGMFASGIVASSAGVFGMLLGGLSLRLQDDDDLPYGQVVLPLGAASVVTGVALIIVGSKRGRLYDAWHESHVAPTFGLLSSPQLRTAGATLGVAGRF